MSTNPTREKGCTMLFFNFEIKLVGKRNNYLSDILMGDCDRVIDLHRTDEAERCEPNRL